MENEFTDKASSKSVQSKINFFNFHDQQAESSQTKRGPISKRPVKAESRTIPVSVLHVKQESSTEATCSVTERLPEKLLNFRTTRMATERYTNDQEMENLEKLQIFKEPMCLISSDKSGQLSVVEETMSQLEAIQYGVNVVAIAGLYRTGKSYLMNRLAHVTSGFALGNTTESKTKGIWVWCKCHPTQRHQVLVMLDTEGLGDARKGDIHHDNRIFTLAALLSSTLVYNMLGAFNQDAIEKLTFITEMSKNMKLSNDMNGDQYFDFVLPRFVLCLRDFFLHPEVDGKPITPDEYLEVCLKSRPVTSKEDEKYNRPRECIKKYFTKRKVMTFDRPGGKRVMTILDTVHDDDLSEDFVEDTVKFTSYIFQCDPKLLANRQPVTGSMLACLAREYVKAMREGSVPCVDNALTVMSRMENEKAMKKMIKTFTENMEALELPIYSSESFLKTKYKLQTSLLKELNKRLVFDDDNKMEKKAEDQMEEIANKTNDRNSKLLQQLCEDKLKALYVPIECYIKALRYKVPGGFKIYKEDMLELEKNFNEDLKQIDFSERQNEFNSFLTKIKKDGDVILASDQQMSKEEKEREVQQKEELAETRMKESQELLMRQIEEKKMNHEREMMRARDEQRQKEDANMMAVRNEWLASRGKSDDTDFINNLKKENERLRIDSERGVLTKAWHYLFH